MTELVEAILASLCDSPSASFCQLSSFTTEDWKRVETWLDTSGMSFYFLDRVRTSANAHFIAPQMLRRLEDKFAQNKLRSADMLAEFLAINDVFWEQGICYANLKGITLCPISCPEVSLRRQADLDFLVDPDDLERARRLLEARDYRVTGENTRTLEMKIGIKLQIGADGRCRPKPGRSVELHTSLESTDPERRAIVRDERLHRLASWMHDGTAYPALDEVDQLLGQALHILSHLRGERTRLSWLLEFRRHLLARLGDSVFWDELRTRAGRHPDAVVAMGLATTLVSDLLGPLLQPDLDIWAEALAPRVRLWALHFGREAVLAEVPGTKLFLLLEDAMAEGCAPRSRSRSARLIPRNLPQRVLQPVPNESLRLRIHRAGVESRFFCYRLRFHVRHGCLHLIHAWRWRTLVKQDGTDRSSAEKGRTAQAFEESSR